MYSPYRKKRQTAAAVSYDPASDSAPKVVASGQGKMAEQIITLAKENGIPIREDPLLADALSRININEVIPPELYAVVAEILAYIFRIREHQIIGQVDPNER